MRCSCCTSYFKLQLFVCLQKKTFSNKRGPPSLQKEVGTALSDTVGGEKQEQEVVHDGEGEEEEDKEKKIAR